MCKEEDIPPFLYDEDKKLCHECLKRLKKDENRLELQTLDKTMFETFDEYRDRLHKLDPIEIGYIELIEYDAEESYFIADIILFHVFDEKIKNSSIVDPKWLVEVPRDKAQNLYQNSKRYPLFASITLFEKELYLYNLLCSGYRLYPQSYLSMDKLEKKKLLLRYPNLSVLSPDLRTDQTFIRELFVIYYAIIKNSDKESSHEKDFVQIPRGKFIDYDFCMSRYQVTFDEYDAFCKDTNRKLPSDEGWGRGRRPVIYVSWHDAKAYVAYLSQKIGKKYRLPTEYEWEYICRAGTKSQYSFGDDDKVATEYAWYKKNSNGTTQPVGEKKPNPWGLYDMHGNVREWCEDWYGSEHSYKVLRGGSWYGYAKWLQSSNRDWRSPNSTNYNIGFRVVLEGALS